MTIDVKNTASYSYDGNVDYSIGKVLLLKKLLENSMTERKKKRNRVVSFVFLFMFIITGSAAVIEKVPRIEFEMTEKDFGNVKQGEVFNHIFKFKNTGDAPLLIRRVRTTCGCTAALVSDRTVEPGEKGEIKVAFNTAGYSGEQRKYIYVESNDPREPNIQLSVVAEIDVPPHAEIYLDKFQIDLGLILENEQIETKVNIRNQGELELRVIPSHRNAAFYVNGERVKSPIKIAAGKKQDLEIQIEPQRKGGLLKEYIMLKSNDPVKSSLSLYLSGYVVTKDQLKELFEKYKNIINPNK